MTRTVDYYTSMITKEHRDKPKFVAMMEALLQPIVDTYNAAVSLNTLFDVDSAVGEQLDFIGEWVGASRTLPYPATNVYFSWDENGIGWDQGVWWQVGESTTYLVSLPDEQYRFLIKAKIAANMWDGTIPSAISIWSTLFNNQQHITVIDNQDMSIDIIISGQVVDAVSLAMIFWGEIILKPSGVRIANCYVGTGTGPVFGLGLENDLIAGLGEGSLVTQVESA